MILTCNSDIICIIEIVKFFLKVFMFVLPAILIVLGIIDLFKAMISSDEKTQKESRKMFLRRLVYMVVIFLVPTIVMALFNILPTDNYNIKVGDSTWQECWKEA